MLMFVPLYKQFRFWLHTILVYAILQVNYSLTHNAHECCTISGILLHWDKVRRAEVHWDKVSWDKVSWDKVSWDMVSWDKVNWVIRKLGLGKLD